MTEKEQLIKLAHDLVDLAILSRKVLANASIKYDKLDDAIFLDEMTKQVLNKYTKKRKDDN